MVARLNGTKKYSRIEQGLELKVELQENGKTDPTTKAAKALGVLNQTCIQKTKQG